MNSGTRKAAVSALMEMEDGGYSNMVLDASIKKNQFSVEDTRFLSRLFYGTLERRITLDYFLFQHLKKKPDPVILNILRIAAYQIYYMETVPNHTAVDESVKLCKKFKKTSAHTFVNAVLRNLLRAEHSLEFEEEADVAKRFSLQYSTEEEIVEDLLRSGTVENVKSLLASSISKPPVYARVNTLKTTEEALLEKMGTGRFVVKPTGFPAAILIEKMAGSLERFGSFRNGEFHIQDLSSQMAASVAVMGLESGLVLDVCAAPGGKTFTMAEELHMKTYQNAELKTSVKAFDIYDFKLRAMEQDIKKLGLGNVTTALQSAAEFLPELENSADRILCDVPCSGFGVISKKPELKYKKRESYLGLPTLQMSILENASKYLKSGGILTYSTCTLLREENEDIVEAFLTKHDEFEACPLPEYLETSLHKGTSHMASIYPNQYESDGFFIATIRKK